MRTTMATENNNKNLNVPNLRFPEFSGEWEKTTLGNIGETFNGLTGKSGADFGQGSPYITYKSIFDNSRIDLSRVELVTITDQERQKGTQNKVQYGDIFFTTSSETPEEVGMTSVLLDDTEDCYLNSFCFGYRLYSKEHILPEYMRFYLRTQGVRKKLFVLAQGSTRFNISKGEVMNVSVAIPEIKEQEKIAKFLSLLEERIDTQIKIIEKLESLIKGLCQKLTQQGNPNTALNEALVCYSSTLQESAVQETGDYPVYGATGVCGYTDTPEVDGDSILIIKDGASVGVTYYASGKYSAIGTLNRLVAKRGYSLRYLYYCLKVFNFAPYRTGLASPHIYFRDYGKAKVWCPSLDEQQRIADALSKVEQKIAIEKSLLEQLYSQKRFLLQAMFI